MRKVNLFLAAFSVLVLAACKEETEKPKVIYENSAKNKDAVAPKVDTTQIEIADLPIQISGTDYLIHPVGDLRVYDKARGSGGNEVSYTISNYNEFEITGFLRNLEFQKVGSDSISKLTDKLVLIQTATFLKSVSDRLKKQYLVYTLADMDTNKDGKLDPSDIKSLYISSIDGKNFTKLSADYEELIDWKVIEAINRLYFRTMEDTNKNGEFDKNDIVHYNMIDLSAKSWEVSSYKPI